MQRLAIDLDDTLQLQLHDLYKLSGLMPFTMSCT